MSVWFGQIYGFKVALYVDQYNTDDGINPFSAGLFGIFNPLYAENDQISGT